MSELLKINSKKSRYIIFKLLKTKKTKKKTLKASKTELVMIRRKIIPMMAGIIRNHGPWREGTQLFSNV